MKRILPVIFSLLVVAALAQAGWQHGRLPERVASHFGFDGRADGWMTRDELVASQAGLVLCLAALIGGLARFTSKVPDRFINLPHREHWLAPGRRAETFGWLERLLLGLGSLLLLFFGWLFQQTFEANLLPEPRLSLQLLPLMVSLFVFTTGLVTMLMFRFRLPPGAARSRRR